MVAMLPTGSLLSEWIFAGGRPDRQSRLARWHYRWQGYWGEHNFLLQQRLPGQPGPAHPAMSRPVFILGLWRTGSTLLHSLLASGPGVAAPRTWQCMNPSTFLLAPRNAAPERQPRPMDEMAVDALSPQEDEFFMLARGFPSVYRAWIDPRRWRDTLPALDQQAWLDGGRGWGAPWTTFLSSCAAESDRSIVVKSPNHTFRAQAIARDCPGARFLWLVRDPVETLESNRKMWNAMMRVYALWNWTDQELDDFLAEIFVRYLGALRWALQGLPNALFIDYDKLVTLEERHLQGIVDWLDPGNWATWRLRLVPALQHAARHPRSAPIHPVPPGGSLQSVLHEIRLAHRHGLAQTASLLAEG